MIQTGNRRETLLILLGMAGFLIFAVFYGRLTPVSAIRMKVGEKEAVKIAATFLEQRGIDFKHYDKQVELVSDGEQMMYLQKKLGLAKAQGAMRDSIPVFYWDITWQRKGDFKIVVGQEQEEVRIPDMDVILTAKVDGKGELFSFDYSISLMDTAETKHLDREDALTLAQMFLVQERGIRDLSGFELKEKVQVLHKGSTDWDFQWEKKGGGIAGERVEVSVSVKEDKVVTFDSSFRVPAGVKEVFERESDMPTAFVVFLVLSWIAVGILFLVLFFMKAIRSELEYRFGLKLGIFLAVLNLISGIVALYDRQWNLFLSAAVGSIFICFGASLIWAVCDSLARVTWKEKLAVVDALIRKRFLTVEFGRAIVRGYGLGFLCLGLVTILSLSGVKSGLVWLTEEGALQNYRATFPFVHIIADALIIALFVEVFFRLFLVSFLRSRIRSLPGIVLLSALIFSVNRIRLFELAPTWAAVLSMFLITGIFTYAFIKYELTTVVTGTFVMYGLVKAWPMLFMGDAPHVANGFVSLALVAVPFILGYIGIRSGESVEQMEEYIPPYMARALEQERMKQELEIARQVQRSFLPRSYPDIEGVDIAAVCVPANEVGGDYYDFIPAGSRCVSIAIGDVSGKGVSAAFYMALTKGILRAEAEHHHSPKEILTKVNARFYENSDHNVFISMVYGTLDPDRGSFTYARAGHNPVILRRMADGKPTTYAPSGIALGLDRGTIFNQVILEETMNVSPGDVLVFYTDGFTEAINWRKEEFGEERLMDLIDRNRANSAEEIVAAIEDDIRTFVGETSQRDDMTMVVVKIL